MAIYSVIGEEKSFALFLSLPYIHPARFVLIQSESKRIEVFPSISTYPTISNGKE